MSQSLSSAAGPQASRPPNAAGPSTKAQEAAVQNSGTEIRDAIRSEALAMGFDAVGFAEARLAEEARDNLGECPRGADRPQYELRPGHAAQRRRSAASRHGGKRLFDAVTASASHRAGTQQDRFPSRASGLKLSLGSMCEALPWL